METLEKPLENPATVETTVETLENQEQEQEKVPATGRDLLALIDEAKRERRERLLRNGILIPQAHIGWEGDVNLHRVGNKYYYQGVDLLLPLDVLFVINREEVLSKTQIHGLYVREVKYSKGYLVQADVILY